MVEKLIGQEVPFRDPSPLIATSNIPVGVVAGIYVYQPAATIVPVSVVNAWLNGDMNTFKLTMENSTNSTLLLAYFSCNLSQQDENYYRVSDYALGLVFKTKDGNQVPTGVFNALLSTQWYSDFWYANGMQNAPVQAYNLNVSNGPKLWLVIGLGVGLATALGIGIYLMSRSKKPPPPLPPPMPTESAQIY